MIRFNGLRMIIIYPSLSSSAGDPSSLSSSSSSWSSAGGIIGRDGSLSESSSLLEIVALDLYRPAGSDCRCDVYKKKEIQTFLMKYKRKHTFDELGRFDRLVYEKKKHNKIKNQKISFFLLLIFVSVYLYYHFHNHLVHYRIIVHHYLAIFPHHWLLFYLIVFYDLIFFYV